MVKKRATKWGKNASRGTAPPGSGSSADSRWRRPGLFGPVRRPSRTEDTLDWHENLRRDPRQARATDLKLLAAVLLLSVLFLLVLVAAVRFLASRI